MIQIDKELIKQRKQELEDIKVELKSYFIGIDKIIDELLDCIQVWYLMPELLRRPIIVNLWGMTGVGKTDLIRKMVKLLKFQDRFAEVELSNSDSSSWNTSVSGVLDDYELNDGKPSIVLFDEIQRFNTMEMNGEPVGQTKFTDFWELLSDGHLSRKSKDDMDGFLMSYASRNKDKARKREKGENVDDSVTYIDQWDAMQLKRVIGVDMEIEDMLDITQEKMVEMIMTAKKKKSIYEPIDHTKTLILISGNLDDAFKMANQASEPDVDADIFHLFTTKVTIVDVKNALLNRFRPEQVARFGNIHLIYPSIKKSDFENLISREINRVQNDTVSRTGVSLAVDNSVNELIYRNGVFPVQGVRPVFSSVTDILEVNLSGMLLKALNDDAKSISISYDTANRQITGLIDNQTVNIPYVGRIDKVRQDNALATVANISTHEAGHAVVYMLLFGLVPLQLQSKIASSYAGGFTFPHQLHRTKQSILNIIKVYLAGGIAEEVVYGTMNASTGRSEDREQATQLALDYIRRYGFDDEFQATYTLETYPHYMDRSVTDLDTEKMVSKLVAETREILIKNIELLYLLSNRLADTGKLESIDVQEIAKIFNLDVAIETEGHLHIFDYDSVLRNTIAKK